MDEKELLRQKLLKNTGERFSEHELNTLYKNIISEGTGKQFDLSHNKNWLVHTRPILEAFFFYAKYFLEMAVKYGKIDKIPDYLPSGLAAYFF
ncbi:hypothetical protein HYV79_03105 [Candidatus Woesearchaeota archaeon]|nr:hypothetical protein [Candidatus Woesearchaeota archaeon]